MSMKVCPNLIKVCIVGRKDSQKGSLCKAMLRLKPERYVCHLCGCFSFSGYIRITGESLKNRFRNSPLDPKEKDTERKKTGS